MPAAPVQAFLSEVENQLGASCLKTDPDLIATHLVDWRGRYQGRAPAVLFPNSTQQVAQIVQLAVKHRVGLVPQGGNTGLTGASVPDNSGDQVVLSLTKMQAIRAVDPANKTMTLEAGVTLAKAQEAADGLGLLFPLTLPSRGSATIGGNLATNCGGTAVRRYGNATARCLGLEVVTAYREVRSGLRGLRKDNTGYDLRDLFVGSEGTLGIITAAVLALSPKPAALMTALAKVPSVESAVGLLGLAQSKAAAQLTGFEFMTASALGLVSQYFPALAQPIQGMGSADLVLLEISSPTGETEAVSLLEAILSEAFELGLVEDALVAQSIQQAQTFWDIRDHITLASSEDGHQIKHDIGLPISCIPDFMSSMQEELNELLPGIRIINFGHLGDGNLHYNLACPVQLEVWSDRNQRHQACVQFMQGLEEEAHQRVHNRVVSLGGSISAEHGLGVMRRDEAARYKGPVEIGLMRSIKTALDPLNILNPGKVVLVS
ncbi:MAG: FAD-binding oxidoreductase [Burkholderiaceae bacterium]